jgi:preprotein translocase subunit SecG
MVIAIMVLHILVCFFLIGVVLLQTGKSADIAAAFGGQSSQTAFGPRGAATLLSKATTWSAVIFMVTSFTLAIVSSRRTSSSVLGNVKNTSGQTKPANTQPPRPGAPNNQPQQSQPLEGQPPSR